MVIKTVHIKDLANELGMAYQDIMQAQKRAVYSAIIKYMPELIQNSPVDTGLFAQSWDLIETEKSVILGNYAPHSPIIEYGARPFVPPIAPLLAWAKRVLGDSSQPPEYSSQVWALAIYTKNKIALKGMAPHNILENAIPEIIKEIKSELEAMR